VLGRISGAFGAAPRIERPSTWFTWHASLFRPGVRVLDVACGSGRHAIAAATLGAQVTAVDADAARLKVARRFAEQRSVAVDWVQADLASYPVPEREYDVVLIFQYLDRRRIPDFRRALRPDGFLLAETFLETQREHGWGPTSEEHLLRPGELPQLVSPLEIVLEREVLEFLEGRPMALASVLAQRVGE
jgi:2-polyprenyl-3-methyl-5-hydroxy-6-metoxy-1,4-benzoquinol methylase